MTTETLDFGLNGVAPDSAPAVWGARFIFPDDMVHNRVGLIGSDKGKDRLIDWLNSGALQGARDFARKNLFNQGSDEVVTLYEDASGIVVGNPRRSFGYLYVAAWLRTAQDGVFAPPAAPLKKGDRVAVKEREVVFSTAKERKEGFPHHTYIVPAGEVGTITKVTPEGYVTVAFNNYPAIRNYFKDCFSRVD